MSAPPPPARAPRHPGRIAVVVVTALLGAFVDVSTAFPALAALRLAETATVLQYLVLAGVSVFATQWILIMAIDALAGVGYLLATRRDATRALEVRVIAVVVNRQLGYLQALFPWVILALAAPLPAWAPAWTVRGALLASAFALGAPVVDRLSAPLVRSITGTSPAGHTDVTPSPRAQWRALVLRQLAFSVAGLAAFLGLFALAPSQAMVLLPLLLAFATAAPFRVAELRKKADSDDEVDPPPIWKRSVDVGRRYDVLFVVLSQVAIGAFLAAKIVPAYSAEQLDATARVTAVRTVPAGGAPAAGPTTAPIRLFLAADNHFHELAGERTGAHLDLADAIVKVAVRPVELDLLSGFTVARFAVARASLEKDAARPLPWIHLGDDGDIGCMSELGRMQTLLPVFGVAPLAVVPGNHDSHFVGNFVWHPSWGPACASSPRATNPAANALLHEISPPSQIIRHSGSGTALAGVQRLGATAGRDVVGVFVDTTDDRAIGVAGVQGEISDAQEVFLATGLQTWRSAWIVFFMHHPFDELTWSSQQRIGRLAAGNALAVVSAHTHLAALRSVTLGGAQVPELVIGSITDPPQETAILEIGEGNGGSSSTTTTTATTTRLALRVRTLPAVARDGATCGDEARAAVPAADCKSAFARANSTCPEITSATEPPVEAAHPQSPAAVKAGQQVRAHALLTCLNRLALLPMTFADAPLDDPTLFPQLDAYAKTLVADGGDAARARLDALTCFGWAGAALQRHKGEAGWSYAHALDAALDVGTVFSAAELTYDAASKTGTQRACSATAK